MLLFSTCLNSLFFSCQFFDSLLSPLRRSTMPLPLSLRPLLTFSKHFGPNSHPRVPRNLPLCFLEIQSSFRSCFSVCWLAGAVYKLWRMLERERERERVSEEAQWVFTRTKQHSSGRCYYGLILDFRRLSLSLSLLSLSSLFFTLSFVFSLLSSLFSFLSSLFSVLLSSPLFHSSPLFSSALLCSPLLSGLF